MAFGFTLCAALRRDNWQAFKARGATAMSSAAKYRDAAVAHAAVVEIVRAAAFHAPVVGEYFVKSLTTQLPPASPLYRLMVDCITTGACPLFVYSFYCFAAHGTSA